MRKHVEIDLKSQKVESDEMPPVHDRKKVMGAAKEYGKMLNDSAAIQVLKTTETATVADLANHMGAMPVRNFSSGQLTTSKDEPLKMGGDYIRELNASRGGENSQACMFAEIRER